jgi:hypothetical protein
MDVADCRLVIGHQKGAQAKGLGNFTIKHDNTTVCIRKEWTQLEFLAGYTVDRVEQLVEELVKCSCRFFVAIEASKSDSWLLLNEGGDLKTTTHGV